MKLFLVICAATLALLGCAANPVNRWAAENRALAEQGTMRWSDYYTQLYDIALNSRVANKGSLLERINIMIYVSKEYEAGRMTKDYFDHMTRLAQAAQASDDERSGQQSSRAMAAALQGVANSYQSAADSYRQQATQPQAPIYTPPAQINCNTYGNRTSCTTQ